MMRPRQLVALVGALFFGALVLLWLRLPGLAIPAVRSYPPKQPKTLLDEPSPLPMLHSNLENHPITQLMDEAEREFEAVRARQSQSLEDAVKEYRRRYGVHPPPRFDEWYGFAKRRGVQLIDEYDTIYDALLPFWAVAPSTIRARTREALGFPNELIGMTIRDGRCTLIQGGGEWQQKATLGMMEGFIAHLPDMDLAFNVHDEPRVLVPYDDLNRLVSTAKEVAMPAAAAVASPANNFSARPADLGDGMSLSGVKTTRFNRFAHQAVWGPSKLSCPPDSPARSLDEPPQDDPASYARGELGFIFNDTAFSDVCLTPSLRETYGFFDRPNAFDVVHDLFPVFSQSKVSSFQDILYPSPWYWYGKVDYDEAKDVEWSEKTDAMYWRGSTTGGFSRDGGWRRQHRQRAVERMNADDTAQILEPGGGGGRDDDDDDGASSSWHVTGVPRRAYGALFDVKFSHVGQCDPEDCDGQRDFFEVVEPADQQDAWASKYLLDMDGNAFSGRFYAFLKSKSLVYKLAIFREWHREWLRPWLHYVPLSLRGDEYVESVRYFAQEQRGHERAQRMAARKRDWAQQVLRNEDFEAWFFRLLLE